MSSSMQDTNSIADMLQEVKEGMEDIRLELAGVSLKVKFLERKFSHLESNVSFDVEHLKIKLTRVECDIEAVDGKVDSLKNVQSTGMVQSSNEDALNAASQVSLTPPYFQPTPPFKGEFLKRKQSFYYEGIDSS